jgi:hypothetical protein
MKMIQRVYDVLVVVSLKKLIYCSQQTLVVETISYLDFVSDLYTRCTENRMGPIEMPSSSCRKGVGTGGEYRHVFI